MRGKKAAGEITGVAEAAAPSSAKEKLSRLNKRHRREAKNKRRIVLAVLLLIVSALAAGAIFDIPYINVVREAASWVRERFTSGAGGEEKAPEYLYFTHPQTAREIEGEVSVLLGLYADEVEGEPARDILCLALLTYDREEGAGEVYLIPEISVAYNAEGGQTDLSRALLEQGGADLLRSTVSNLAGTDVDYLLMLEFWGAVKLLQGTVPPAVLLEDQTVLINPLNGETDFLVAGQEIGDADRLIFYLLATDELEAWASFSARLGRVKAYLPDFLSASGGVEAEALATVVSALNGEYGLEPGTGSARGDADYLASMLRSFAELGEGKLAVKAVPAVEVLNGCGIPDLGKMVGGRLAALGVPVAGTGGNAKISVDGEEINDFSHDRSTIKFRSEDPRVQAFARYLGVLLSIDNVVAEMGPGPEIILIAGRDLAP